MSSSTASKLDSLVGLATAKHLVRRLAQDDRGVHALLLYGSRGTGKDVLANLLTELWVCTNISDEGADGTCRACAALGRGNSPDVLHIGPAGRSAIIPVTAITNDKIKDEDPPVPLLNFFRTPPMFARHKVAIIHDAHRMNHRAANALLKTLEEPHPHAKIILTTDSVGSLLPTIISRCLAAACEAPSEEELRQAFPNATSDQIRLSEGTPGRIRNIEERQAAYDRLLAFARSLPNRKKGEALVATEEFLSISEQFKANADTTARAAQAAALDSLATFFAREPGIPPHWTHLIIESHRRILGNGQAGIVYDALFTAMLGSR